MKNTPSITHSPTTVLVSGGSIAGPAVAYWLNQYGFKVTLVERNNGTRSGGQAIDIRAVATDVVKTSSSSEFTFTGGLINNDDLEILSDDFGQILYEATRNDVEYLFDDTVTTLTETQDGVDISFEKNAPRTFDLVIGADGLHSRVRNLRFGPEAHYVRPVNLEEGVASYAAIFSVPNVLDLDHWQVDRLTEEALTILYVAKENTVSRAMLRVKLAGLSYDYHNKEQQKRIVVDYFTDDQKWIMPKLIESMWQADDFYFDSLSQARMDGWSQGRVSLVGDAAFCPSAISGQGTSVALVGAYVLAGELAAAHGDFALGFENYENDVRHFVENNQQLPFLVRNYNFVSTESLDPKMIATQNPIFLNVVNGYELKDYSAQLKEPSHV